jgi:molecular chaperone HtpG
MPKKRRSSTRKPARPQPLVEALKTALGERVREVRVSQRLTESPSCLVLEEYDMALHLQRMMRAAGHDVPAPSPAWRSIRSTRC